MKNVEIATGVVHELPEDLKVELIKNSGKRINYYLCLISNE